MELLITDNEKYTKNFSGQWVLVAQNHVISSNCLASDLIDHVNLSLSSVEMASADRMLVDLDHDVQDLLTRQQKIKLNPFVETRSEYDRLYSILFASYRRLLVSKYIMEVLITKVLAAMEGQGVSKLTLILDRIYELIDTSIFSEHGKREIKVTFLKVSAKRSVMKNLFYLAYSLRRAFAKRQRLPTHTRHIALFMYDHINEYNFFKTFFRLVKDDPTIFLSIVRLSSGISRQHTYSNSLVEGGNIKIYDYTLFRKPIRRQLAIPSVLANSSKALRAIQQGDLLFEQDLHYTWISNVFDKINPDVCLYDNLGEVGRVVSDVARYKKVTSAVVDYGVFTDDPYYMAANTQYDHRACISQSSVDIWKGRGDPTRSHSIVGFCKLDDIVNLSLDRTQFLLTHGLNPQRKTVFFASTWSGSNKVYDHEKKVITDGLSRVCHERGWNLVIKKHPSEFDQLTNDVIKKNGFLGQVVLENTANLYETIHSVDLVCSQASGVFVEAMYFNKPFCFISLSEEKPLASYFTVCKESFAPIFRSMEELSRYATKIFEGGLDLEISEQIGKTKEYYLYKTDGHSSGRLKDLLLTVPLKK